MSANTTTMTGTPVGRDNHHHLNVNIPTWLSDAACASYDPDLFFPGRTSQAVTTAKQICDSCPIEHACRDWALAISPGEDASGIFGGLTKTERDRMRKHQRQQQQPTQSTPADARLTAAAR